MVSSRYRTLNRVEHAAAAGKVITAQPLPQQPQPPGQPQLPVTSFLKSACVSRQKVQQADRCLEGCAVLCCSIETAVL